MPDLEHFACKVTDFFADMQIKIAFWCDFYCVGCSRLIGHWFSERKDLKIDACGLLRVSKNVPTESPREWGLIL